MDPEGRRYPTLGFADAKDQGGATRIRGGERKEGMVKVDSQVPKSEAPGATIFSGGTHFVIPAPGPAPSGCLRKQLKVMK